jgi:prolipoprotein diacylglyceryl transferase
MNPDIATFGGLRLTWHGVFTAVGIAAGVYLAAWLGRRQGFTEDDAYSVALVGVPAGIIGARAMYVLENNEAFRGQWLDVLKINEGGITVWGSVIAGVLAAVVYGLIRRMPVTRGLDVAGFGLLLGMAIGRIGDLINGEHIGKASDLPWAIQYTHPNSPAFTYGPTHPATTYEMIGDFLIIGLMALLFVKLWQHRPGIVFFTGLVLYSAMRFGVSYLRIDSGYGCPNSVGCPDKIIKDWMTFPQVVSSITFAVGMAGLIWAVLRGEQPAPAGTVTAAGAPENPLDRERASSRTAT